MPRQVDHEVRRREMTDAVCRITAKGGLTAATFREVAAEAGVSVRLVQYYFGAKDALLLATQRHVAQRATARLTALINSADPPRVRLRAILRSFIPTDDESRENMLMFVALHTASLVDPTLARREARDVPDALHRTVKTLLVEAGLPRRADAENEAAILISVVPSLAQVVLDGSMEAKRAFEIIDYAMGKALA
ncbi:MAG: TetR/AcrR family transcriptional regulator [Actinomycetota bacterium]|nr:TetR/AcrR family transcriptional regulator [Actinomycetota bacterium]